MKLKIILSLSLLLFLSACANGKLVPRSQGFKTVTFAKVVDKEEVTIGGSRSGIGSYVGSLAAIADSSSNNFVGLVVRGFAGAFVGGAVEEAVTRKDGALYTVETKSGTLIEVISRNKELKAGDCVRIARGGRKSKVNEAETRRCAHIQTSAHPVAT